MIDLTMISEIIANNFFGGSVTLAGMTIFTVVVAVLFAISKDPFATLIMSIPTALIFNNLGLLSEDMLIILIIVAVLGLAYASRNVWRDE